MNIVLFDQNDETDGHVVVRDRRASHIRKILKLDVGAQFRIGRIDDGIGLGRVVELGNDGEHGTVKFNVEALDQPPPEKSPVELVLALPRPKSLKRCLRAIANLGIKSVHLIHSIRVDKSYWTAPALSPAIAREAMLEGLSIACDTQLPILHQHKLFKPFVQDVAPHLVHDLAFVAHPTRGSKQASGTTCIPTSSKPVIVAIGPEGGFSDYEIGLFNEAGFQNLSLGSRVYSVECALPVLEATIRAALR